MTWNDCPLCGKEMKELRHSDNESAYKISCGNYSSWHYCIIFNYNDQKEILISAEWAAVGKFRLYRNIFNGSEFEISIGATSNTSTYCKYFGMLDLTLSPKITEEYLNKLLLFS